MPKTRGSNTLATGRTGRRSGGGSIGTGGGGSSSANDGIDEVEIPQRLEDRLAASRTIDVTMESRTRGRNENIQVTFNPTSPGIASVRSESGSVYEVNYEENTCNCMHYRMRESGCRHIDATNIARGELHDGRGNESAHGQAISQQEVSTVLESQRGLDAQAEEQREALTREFEDDNFFYSDNVDEFRETMERVTYENLPYEYDNVLNGSNNTFGIELEFVGGDADAIARELYDLEICAYNYRVGYHSPGVPGKWRLERDGSVSSGTGGGEIVSPVLKDTPETWRNIETICEVAKRHGAQINYQTGAHVHIGMEPLDTARQRWRRFFNIVGSYEECIFRLAGGDLGGIRSGYSHYSMPFSNRASDAAVARFTMDTPEDVNRLTRNVSGMDRYYGINLTNVYQRHSPDTVEFRYFNGSLNPAQIQANIKIANGIMMASEKARTKDLDDMQVSESMKKRGNMLKESAGNNRRDEAQIMKFVDIMFSRKKDKDNILSVFTKNRWR